MSIVKGISGVAQAAQSLEDALMEAVNAAAAEGLRIAQDLSTGQYSSKQLRKMGHPYAKRNPRPPQDAAIINLQTGIFKSAWQVIPAAKNLNSISAFIRNDSFVADFLQYGTDRMMVRPIRDRVEEKLANVLEDQVRHYLGKWESQVGAG